MEGRRAEYKVQDCGLRPEQIGYMNEVLVIEGVCIDVLW